MLKIHIISYNHLTINYIDMTLTELLVAELKDEAIATRELLARVPLDKKDWKPHAKSMSLGSLSSHVAELNSWVAITLLQDELDFAVIKYVPFEPKDTSDLLAFFEKYYTEALDTFSKISESVYEENWTMRAGEMIYFTQPKKEVIRKWVFNHLVHHRAQLGVYLRMLEVPLPSVYGPTAG